VSVIFSLSESPPVECRISSDYRSVPVSNILTALIETEGKLLVFFDRLEPTIDSNSRTKIGKVIRELQVELHFSPQQYKAVAEAMMKAVRDFEEEHKTSIKPPEKESTGGVYA